MPILVAIAMVVSYCSESEEYCRVLLVLCFLVSQQVYGETLLLAFLLAAAAETPYATPFVRAPPLPSGVAAPLPSCHSTANQSQ